MDRESSLPHYSALDGALIGAFFISYSVFALVQLNNLFNGRFILFVILAACAALIARGFVLYDYSEICAGGRSAIICGGQGRGLAALGMIWVYVSGAMFVLFGVAQGIRILRR